MEVRYLAPARQEYWDAVEFYESQAVGLGADFVAEVERAEQRLVAHPHTGSEYKAGSRRTLISRFPFWLVYSLEADHIVVIAVAHERRRPDYWRARKR
jgi:plasmid stabilization system protein ParE